MILPRRHSTLVRRSGRFIKPWLALLCLLGCGTTKSQTATEQLLVSDAVDCTVASIDFRPLAGQKVYFNTRYIRSIKGPGFVSADYIISSLRQQMVAARCLLQDKHDDADFIVEGRVGTLGINGHGISYGIPGSNILSSAAPLITPAMTLPAIPEISIARRNELEGAAKIGIFAYHRETGQPVWQAGLAEARSDARDTWIFGVGPFQRGTIYDRPQLAGADLRLPSHNAKSASELDEPVVNYDEPFLFRKNYPSTEDSSVELATHEEAVDGEGESDGEGGGEGEKSSHKSGKGSEASNDGPRWYHRSFKDPIDSP